MLSAVECYQVYRHELRLLFAKDLESEARTHAIRFQRIRIAIDE